MLKIFWILLLHGMFFSCTLDRLDIIKDAPLDCVEGTILVGEECVIRGPKICEENEILENDICIPLTGSIIGFLCSQLGEWLSDAEVIIEKDMIQYTATTDSFGSFSFTKIPIGYYTLNIVHDNESENTNFSVEVLESQATRVGVSSCVPPNGTLQGSVCNSDTGEWFSGVDVVLKKGNEEFTTITDEDGFFVFFDVEPDIYELYISSDDGFVETQEDLVVLPGGLTVSSDETCTISTGSIVGFACNTDSYELELGVIASIEAPLRTLQEISDVNGVFHFKYVPVGTYTIDLQSSNFSGSITDVEVIQGEIAMAGDPECIIPKGGVIGRACNYRTGEWIGYTSVTLDDGESSISTTTDTDGNFVFEDIDHGIYILTVGASGFVFSQEVIITPDTINDISPTECEQLPSHVEGTICAGSSYNVNEVLVSVTVDGQTYTTETDVDGYFSFSDLSDGNYIFTASRNSFSSMFSGTLIAGETTYLEPSCLLPTSRIAVITGAFDEIQTILTDLDFIEHTTHSYDGLETINSLGHMDIVEGKSESLNDWFLDDDSKYWLREFLTDSETLENYDIIFLNCGFNDSDIKFYTQNSELPDFIIDAVNNLRNFVYNGGSIYASDWTAPFLNMVFPDKIKFYGDENIYDDMFRGVASATILENGGDIWREIVDPDLQDIFGNINFTKVSFFLNNWAMMDSISNQDLSELTIILKDDIFRFGGENPFSSTAPLEEHIEAPIVARFNYGSGRVIFTSAHVESQITRGLDRILRYIIFEL